MRITIAYDASVAAAPAAFMADVGAVAAFFDQQITSNVIVTISVGYGEINGVAIGNALGESESQSSQYSYAQLRAALAGAATSPTDAAALASLPSNAPAYEGTITVPDVEAGLLGLGGGGMSGYVGFSSSGPWDYSTTGTAAGAYDFLGTAEHEISEVLGRVSYLDQGEVSPLDLFRYSAPGQPDIYALSSNYFSADGGTTDLAAFNTRRGGDYGDWASSVTSDAYDAFTGTGEFDTVTPADMAVMDTLGYTLATPAGSLTIAGTNPTQTVSVRGTIQPFATVALGDPNGGRADTATVTLSAPGAGSFSNLGSGSFDPGTATYTVTGTTAAVQSALQGLVFVPNAAAMPTGQSSGINLSLSLTDGLARVSAATTSLHIVGAGQIVIAGTTAGQMVSTPGALAPFAGVVIADPNAGQTETVTITPNAAGHGSFSNLGPGAVDPASGVYAVTGSLAVVQQAVAGLIFRPGVAAVRSGNDVTGFTISVNDGLVSDSDALTSVIATPGPPPTISGAVSGQTVAASGAIAPFAGVTIADADPSLAFALTVTLSGAANGVLGNTAGGTYDPARGVYSLTSTLAAVTAALAGLVFAPNEATAVAAGPGGDATTFTIAVDDGVASPATNTGTGVNAVPIATPLPDMASLLSPVGRLALSQSLAALAPAGTQPGVVTLSGAGTAAAPVSGTLDALVIAAGTGAVAVPAGFHAAYLLGGPGRVVSDGTGGTLIVAAANGATVFAGPGDTVIGGNGAVTLVAGGGAETLVGGTGASLMALGSGADRVTSQGVDTILGSVGAATITASAAPLYFGGTGALDLIATSGAPTLVGGGAETVSAGASAPLVFGGAGPLAFTEGSGAGTVVGGAQATVSLAGGTAPLLFFGYGASTYTPGLAVDTILGGTGSLTATGGAAGTLFFGGTAGGNAIGTGPGSATIIGGGEGDVLTASGAGGNVIGASGGAETIDGAAATGADVFFAGNGSDCIAGGAGTTAMVAGSGNDTLVAGSGSTLFLFVAGGGPRSEMVQGFVAGSDFVELPGYAPGTAASAIATATQGALGATLALPDGTQITFRGVTNFATTSFL